MLPFVDTASHRFDTLVDIQRGNPEAVDVSTILHTIEPWRDDDEIDIAPITSSSICM